MHTGIIFVELPSGLLFLQLKKIFCCSKMLIRPLIQQWHYTTRNTLYCTAFHYSSHACIALHTSIYSCAQTYYFLLYLHTLLILSLHCTALKYTTFTCTAAIKCSTHVITSLNYNTCMNTTLNFLYSITFK